MATNNVLAQKRKTFGGDIPIWLGTSVPRVPSGGVLASGWCKAGMFIPAGAPINLASGVITPFIAWQVVSIDSTNHKLTIKASEQFADILPKADDILTPVGTTFATTGAAGKVSAIAADETEGQYVVTFTDGKLDGVSANSYIAYSSATAVAASGKELANQPNGYLYADIYIDTLGINEEYSNIAATGSVVVEAPEGILIDNTIGKSFKTQLKTAIPNVQQF